MRKIILLLVCFIASQRIALSQAALSQDSTFSYSATLQGALTSSTAPYFFYANSNGVIPTHGSFALAGAALHKVYNKHNPRFFQWSGGAEFYASANKNASVFLTNLFIAGKVGPVELSIGQRKEFSGLGDSTLTSGSIAMSSNARPYPKIQISTPSFVNLLPRNDIISFKFSYSDGILGPARIIYGNVSNVPEIYMHQKSLYIKLGKSSHLFNLYAGFNHQAMWGGEDKIFSGGLKKSDAYNYVVFGKSWGGSRVGNHFGTIDLGMEFKRNGWNVLLYRQSIYEDGSLLKLSNIADGLNGIRLKRAKKQDNNLQVTTALFEFIYTKNQGGNVFDFGSGTFGRDNYFNHYVYRQGWSYKGRALGTPLIAPQHLVREELRTSPNIFTPNNRLLAFHAGFDASLRRMTFLLKGSYSVNSGTYLDPIEPAANQTSLFARFEAPVSFLSGSYLNISLGTDFGQLYNKSTAVMLGWRKSGFIR